MPRPKRSPPIRRSRHATSTSRSSSTCPSRCPWKSAARASHPQPAAAQPGPRRRARPRRRRAARRVRQRHAGRARRSGGGQREVRHPHHRRRQPRRTHPQAQVSRRHGRRRPLFAAPDAAAHGARGRRRARDHLALLDRRRASSPASRGSRSACAAVSAAAAARASRCSARRRWGRRNARARARRRHRHPAWACAGNVNTLHVFPAGANTEAPPPRRAAGQPEPAEFQVAADAGASEMKERK